jgi:DNA-directed RNA polymerase specialized sigma24 family protein
LPKLQRQAFLLHVLENYSIDEIAMLQDRPEGEVKADIQAARRTLRERLLESGYLKQPSRQPSASEMATVTGGA